MYIRKKVCISIHKKNIERNFWGAVFWTLIMLGCSTVLEKNGGRNFCARFELISAICL